MVTLTLNALSIGHSIEFIIIVIKRKFKFIEGVKLEIKIYFS